MEKFKVKPERAIKELKEIFEIKEDAELKEGFSFQSGGKFYIDKRHLERYEVIGKLQDYFADKVVEGGYVEVDPITFLFTTFEIKQGQP